MKIFFNQKIIFIYFILIIIIDNFNLYYLQNSSIKFKKFYMKLFHNKFRFPIYKLYNYFLY